VVCLCFHLVFFLLETLVLTCFLLNFTMVSLCPTFGGTSPGLRAELIHSVKEQLSLIVGCAFVTHPSAFASISVSHCLHSSSPSMLIKGIRFHLQLQKLKHLYFSEVLRCKFDLVFEENNFHKMLMNLVVKYIIDRQSDGPIMFYLKKCFLTVMLRYVLLIGILYDGI
jgi:hypothetical protein